MALNASGPIALAGSTAGVSIALELSLGATTAITLNDAAVRTLAGVSSGAIVMPTNFYGKSNNPFVQPTIGLMGGLSQCGYMTRVNACRNQVGSIQNIAGMGQLPGGARVGVNAVFYGGYKGAYINNVVRVNTSGVKVGSTTNVGTARYGQAGAQVGVNGLYYGGSTGCALTNIVTRINACGALVGSQTNVGNTGYFGGAGTGNTGIFGSGTKVTRINACGAIIGSISTIAYNANGSGAFIGSAATYYYNLGVTRLNVCGAVLSASTIAGFSGVSSGSARVGTIGIWAYNCNTTCCCSPNWDNGVTGINACGALVGANTYLYGISGGSSATGAGI